VEHKWTFRAIVKHKFKRIVAVCIRPGAARNRHLAGCRHFRDINFEARR